jgi:hypothetical protein
MPPGKPPTSPSEATAKRSFATQRPKQEIFHNIVIYGAGGIGKTELAANIAAYGERPLFIDLENSTKFLDVDKVQPTVQTWDELRAVLQNPSLTDGFSVVVIDSLTKAQELAEQWVLANIKTKSGHFVKNIEDFGFGAGYSHVYETFLQLLGDLDAVNRRGKHVICTAHDCVANAPNPSGEDWIRYEPRLQSPNGGKNSIRLRVKEWCDHLFFIGYDMIVDEDGKAEGGGSRTIYTSERPTHVAKSRSLSSPVPYDRGEAEIWKQLLNKE